METTRNDYEDKAIRDAWKDAGSPPTLLAEERIRSFARMLYDVHWSRATVVMSVARALAREPAQPVDLASRYATFRQTVTRVVGEEAPRAVVVTDIMNGSLAVFIAWLEWPGAGQSGFIRPQDHMLGPEDEAELRRKCQLAAEDIGSRALGKVYR